MMALLKAFLEKRKKKEVILYKSLELDFVHVRELH